MISMPLTDFGKSFKLNQAKEVMPYKLYTKAFIKAGGLASLEQIKNTPDQDNVQHAAALQARRESAAAGD